MTIILTLMLSLTILMAINTILGTFYNTLGTKEFSFSWKVFAIGVLKALILAVCLLGFAYVSEINRDILIGISKYTDYAPEFILTGGIIFYFVKDAKTFKKALGINVVTDENKEVVVSEELEG